MEPHRIDVHHHIIPDIYVNTVNRLGVPLRTGKAFEDGRNNSIWR